MLKLIARKALYLVLTISLAELPALKQAVDQFSNWSIHQKINLFISQFTQIDK